MIYNNQLIEYVLSESDKAFLDILLPWKKEYWKAVGHKKTELKEEIKTLEVNPVRNDSRINELKNLKRQLNDRGINSIKENIKRYLYEQQNFRCYYCEGEFFTNRIGVGTPTIDHIADKASYPNYLYIPKNLVLCCKECNGFNKKSNTNVIVPECIKTTYNSLESNDFIFVHPYLDVKEEHMNYIEADNIWITVNNSEKGERSINMFKLNEARYVLDRYKPKKLDMSKEDDQLIDKITRYAE